MKHKIIKLDTWTYKDAIYQSDDNRNVIDFTNQTTLPIDTLQVAIRKNQPKDYPKTILLDKRYKGTKEFLKLNKLTKSP